jgi:hypothetical protein
MLNVKLVGSNGKKRVYPMPVLRAARPLYEGCAVYTNHVNPGERRKIEDRFGTIRNVREGADGLYGDLFYNKKHALAAQLTEAAESDPSSLGLSHDASGPSCYKNGREMVSEITEVRSCDLVARPASTDGLFESLRESLDALFPRRPSPAACQEFIRKIRGSRY